MTKATEKKRQAKLLVDIFDDGLVVKDLLYYHIKCRFNLLMPQGLDGCLPRPKLLKGAPADTNLQPGQSCHLCPTDSLDKRIVLFLRTEDVIESRSNHLCPISTD